MKDTRTATLEELRAMKDRGELLPMKADAPEIEMPDDFWDDAEVVVREPKKSVHLRVDAEVLQFFRAQGKGHLTRMNAVLKSYVDAQKKHHKHTPS